jgi:hypothetical protein
MSQPPNLQFNAHSYLTVTTLNPPPPSLLQQRSSNPIPLSYVSTVGSLPDEHIYQIDNTPRGSEQYEQIKADVIRTLQGTEGVKGVKMMEEPKMRVKRGGEF